MLIFDGFGSREKAEQYAKAVTEKYRRSATVFDTQQQSDVVTRSRSSYLPLSYSWND